MNTARWFLLIVGLMVAGFAVAQVVDRGAFDRIASGIEGLYWTEAGQASEGAGAPGTLQLYSKLLSPLSGTDLGAVGSARRVLTELFLPLFALFAFILAYRRGRWLAGMAAAIGTLVAAPLVLTAGSFTPAAPAAVLALLAITILDGSSSRVSWALAGALTCIAAWFHPGIAWSLGLIFLVAGLVNRKVQPRTTGGLSLLAGFGAVAVIAMVMDLTSPVTPTPSLIDVYRGHRPEASGVEPRRGDRDTRRWWGYGDYVREVSRIEGKRVDLGQASRYWGFSGLTSALTHPLAEGRRVFTRTLAVYQGDPLPRALGVEFLELQSEGFMIRLFRWAGRLLIPLGVWGLICSRRQLPWVVWAGTATGLVAATISFADADGRLVSLVCVMVGLGLLVRHLVVSRGTARLRILGGGVVAIGIWGFLPLVANPAMGLSSDDYLQLGLLYDREQRGSAALREYERALRLEPTNPYPRLAIAGMLARDNVNQEAAQELEALLEQHPDFVPALAGAARMYQSLERWDEAAVAHGRLIDIEPWNPEHWNNLGTMYVQIGYYDQAVRALESAIELNPSYTTAIDNLAGLRRAGLAPGLPDDADPVRTAQESILELIRTQNLDAARDALAGAYRDFGENRVEFRFVEGTLHLVARDLEKAIEVFESVRKEMPGNIILLNNLGAAYRETGRLEKAKEVFEEGLRIQPQNHLIRQNLDQVKTLLDSPGG